MSITATHTQFDLRSLIREHLETEDVESPKVLAARVIDEIPAEALRGVVEQMLPEFCRHVIAETRRGTLKGNGRSRKSQHAGNVLQVLVSLGPNNLKRLGDCTLEDIRLLVTQHEDIARFNMAEAEGYKRLAQRMVDSKAQTVARLGVEAVCEALDD